MSLYTPREKAVSDELEYGNHPVQALILISLFCGSLNSEPLAPTTLLKDQTIMFSIHTSGGLFPTYISEACASSGAGTCRWRSHARDRGLTWRSESMLSKLRSRLLSTASPLRSRPISSRIPSMVLLCTVLSLTMWLRNSSRPMSLMERHSKTGSPSML